MRGIVRNARAHLGDSNLRKLRAHDGTLGWVVIDEDKAVDAEIQLARHSLDVLVLRLPIRFEARDVFELQHRVWMCEAASRSVLVVLRADC